MSKTTVTMSNGYREYTCKKCAKTVRVWTNDWKGLPQRYKRWCPDCYKSMKASIQSVKEMRGNGDTYSSMLMNKLLR